MNKRKSAAIVVFVIFMLVVSGCSRSMSFKKMTFNTEYVPAKIPETVPDWWRSNLTQYLDLCYWTNGKESAFGALSADIFKPDFYSTYTSVGILKSLSEKIDNPEDVLKWIKTLKIDSCICGCKGNSFDIMRFYREVTLLKELGGTLPDKIATLRFFKKYEKKDGTFGFGGLQPDSLNGCISQTYFVVSVMKMLGVSPDSAKKFLNFSALSDTLKSYISKHIGNASLKDVNKSGYLISAIYELSYIDRKQIPQSAYVWFKQSVRSISSLPYGFLYIAVVGNLAEAVNATNFHIEIDRQIKKYLNEKVIPQQNLSGGFGLQGRNSNFLEPMLTYKIVRLFEISNLRYPNINKMLETLKSHRINKGWIKFYTFKPSVQATYYAVRLAAENGISGRYSENKLKAFLDKKVRSITAEPVGERISPGITHTYFPDAVAEDLADLYYTSATYESLGVSPPKKEIMKDELTLLNELPKNYGNEQQLLFNAESLSYFILTSDNLECWPEDKSLITKIEVVSRALAKLTEKKEFKNIDILYTLFVLNTVVSFYSPQEASTNSQIINRVLSVLRTPDGFKMSPDLDIADTDSTFIGLKIKSRSGYLDDVDKEKVIKFVMDSMEPYGFDYAPGNKNSYPDLKSTYEALWILSYLTSGFGFNRSESG